jgi:hypothetical protein
LSEDEEGGEEHESAASDEHQDRPSDLDGFAPEVFGTVGAEGEPDSAPMVEPQPAASSSGPDIVAQGVPPTSDSHPMEQSQPAVPSGLRSYATYVLVVPGGKIAYYGANFQVVTAQCENRDHGKCVLTRTMAAGRRVGQGRPMGLFMAWLAMGHLCATKEEHWDRANWPSLATREEARKSLVAMDLPDAQGLLSAERPLQPGEGPEPMHIA